jgi:hypothetical protein
MTPAEAKPFLYAVNAAIASHSAAIASLHAMRAVIIASVGCDATGSVFDPVDPAEAPAAREAPPTVVAVAVASASPAPRKGKGGRPRKHFADRTEPATGAERVALSRRAAHVAKHVSQHTLSLEENIDFSKRERDVSQPVAKPVSQQSGLMRLPPDFHPDEQGARLATEKLGEIGAANCLAKFRDLYGPSEKMFTHAGWQGKYRNFVRDERSFATPSFATVSQHQLPLVRDLGGGGHAESPVAVGVIIRRETPQADAWEKYNGKRFPWGIRGEWPVPTPWPPGFEPDRREVA